MRIAHSVKIGAWILILLNILMAFGSIWIFMRMAPAIELIILRNEVSLEACEEMLAALARRETTSLEVRTELFYQALERARNNITEKEEPDIIEEIARSCERALTEGGVSLEQTVSAIRKLGTVNRAAMNTADNRARQLGYAGAWGVVFMATSIFFAGMLFLRSLRKNLTDPLLEISDTVSAFRDGNVMRRCSLKNPPRNIRQVLNNVNDLLDICCSRNVDG